MPSSTATTAFHLPAPWKDSRAYEQLCTETISVEQFHDYRSLWQVRRIRPESSAEHVYQRLPSHPDYEYAGYLTKTQIRYRRCGKVRAYLPPKPCTFHSHPTALQRGEPDIPSATDIRLFLFNRSWRTITVGRNLLWVLDKTEASFGVIRHLAEWERDNLAKEARKLEGKHRDWTEGLAARGLGEVGVVIRTSSKQWAIEWPDLLQCRLGLRSQIFKRRS